MLRFRSRVFRFRDLGVFVFEIWVPRFRYLGVFVFDLGYFVFEFWVLRLRVLGTSFSKFGCFVFEIWVLRASVFVFECVVFETTPQRDTNMASDHTKLYKFGSTFFRISRMKYRTDLILGEASNIFISFYFLDSGLSVLNGLQFYF